MLSKRGPTVRLRLLLLVLFALALAACASGAGDAGGDASEDAVIVDNRSPLARAQYLANVDFAKTYRPNCLKTTGRPHVLVTGFGRFMNITDNATGRIVSRLAGFDYPLTDPPAAGAIDPPGPQTRSGSMVRARLPKTGEVDICGMILPVFWDLAAIVIAKEVEQFQPDLVIMNGVAGARQDLYVELGSVNRAMRSADGSDILVPYAPEGREPTIIQSAGALRGLLMSWDPVRSAAEAAIESFKDEVDDSLRFGDVLTGAKLAGFPRGGNTYLCNNVTYVTNYLMDNPGKSVTLLKALDRAGPEDDYVRVKVTHDHRKTPRVFMHWPSDLVGHPRLLDRASDVMKAVIDAQLQALKPGGQAPTTGTNAQADPSLAGGTFF